MTRVILLFMLLVVVIAIAGSMLHNRPHLAQVLITGEVPR